MSRFIKTILQLTLLLILATCKESIAFQQTTLDFSPTASYQVIEIGDQDENKIIKISINFSLHLVGPEENVEEIEIRILTPIQELTVHDILPNTELTDTGHGYLVLIQHNENWNN